MDPTKIQPALSADEWATGTPYYSANPLRWHVRRDRAGEVVGGEVTHYWCNTGADIPVEHDELLATIAMCNAALPDNDPRKITRNSVQLLRNVADGEYGGVSWGTSGDLLALAAALSAYLPPE